MQGLMHFHYGFYTANIHVRSARVSPIISQFSKVYCFETKSFHGEINELDNKDLT